MIRTASVAVCALMSLAGCASDVVSGHAVAGRPSESPLAVYIRSVVDPVDSDIKQLDALSRAGDQNPSDWTPVCAALASDDQDATRILQTYRWPARAQRPAKVLAAGLTVSQANAQSCVALGEVGMDEVINAVEALPNLVPAAAAMRSALGK